LCKQHGLNDPYPLAVSMAECANLHSALEAAALAVRAGKARTVLLISVDLADRVSPVTRLVGGGLSVMSDAASSCILTAYSSGGYEVLDVVHEIGVGLGGGEMTDREELVVRLEKSERLRQRLFEEGDVDAGDISQILASNLSPSVLSVFFQEMGLDSSLMYRGNLARIAHCLSSDCLINLHDYERTQRISAGDTFLLYGTGPRTWGNALLRATEANDIE
jgi:3-oxoacyl-[acyl-carrier-protein] synthase III